MSDRDDNDLIRQRREKLEALRARGIEPFGTRFPVTHWAKGLTERLGTASDDELKAFGPVPELTVRINSPGGSVFDGVAIYNALKRREARVTVWIDGIADWRTWVSASA